MWRQVLRSYWNALRRFTFDRRARGFVLKITGLVVYVVASLVLFGIVVPFWSAEGPAAHLGFQAFILGTGLIAFFIFRRRGARSSQELRFSLTSGRDLLDASIGSEPNSDAFHGYLTERAVILATLVARAGAEIQSQQSGRANHRAGEFARQVQNKLLREQGLWDKLEENERELMRAPGGSWTTDQQAAVVAWCEQLRLLRWVLRVDTVPTPLAQFPGVDFALDMPISRIMSENGVPAPMVHSADVRLEREMAFVYVARVVSELRFRNLIPDSPDLAGWTDSRDAVIGASTDYLVGSKTVGELADGELLQFFGTMCTRVRYLNYLQDQLDNETADSFDDWASRTMNG